MSMANRYAKTSKIQIAESGVDASAACHPDPLESLKTGETGGLIALPNPYGRRRKRGDKVTSERKQFTKRDIFETMPPGKVKIIEALKSLLEIKEYDAITTAEIARTAGVSEPLIYKHFKDKRDLLYVVLRHYLDRHLARFELDLKGINGTLNKLRRLIWMHINVYASNRIIAKLLSLVVRGMPGFYTSETYDWIVTVYAKTVLNVIEEGIANGEIRNDIPPKFIRQVLLGSLEHICLREVIFDKDIDPDELTDNLCKLLFRGIENTNGPTGGQT